MKFRGQLKTVSKDIDSNNYLLTFELIEGNVEEVDKLRNRDLTVEADIWRDIRSGEANRLFWDCIGKIAKSKNEDKWRTYLDALKHYGQFTYACIKPEAVEDFKKQWRECEEIGELEINGRKAVQLLCYFGSSTYNTQEFAQLLDGVIAEMKDAGLETPASEELERAYEQWTQYCNKKKGALSVEG